LLKGGKNPRRGDHIGKKLRCVWVAYRQKRFAAAKFPAAKSLMMAILHMRKKEIGQGGGGRSWEGKNKNRGTRAEL